LNLAGGSKEFEIVAAGIGKGNFKKDEYEINTNIYFHIPTAPGNGTDLGTDIFDNVEEIIAPFEEQEQVYDQLSLILNDKQLDEYMPIMP